MAQMTTDEWVEYYLNNPDALRAFVEIANEQANNMADEIERLRECAGAGETFETGAE